MSVFVLNCDSFDSDDFGDCYPLPTNKIDNPLRYNWVLHSPNHEVTVTSKQRSSDRYDHVLPFIKEHAQEYYGGNIDRGFRHWAFATIFTAGHDIQGGDIVDYTAIDGADDFEIDGYYIPELDDDSVVNLFQSKHRQPGQSMGAAELSAFLNAPKRILNANEVAACRNEETKALHDRIVAMLRQGNTKCSINLVWATSGTLTPPARRHIQENRSCTITTEIEGNPTELNVTLQCWDLGDLDAQHRMQQESDDTFSKCDHSFTIEPGSYHQTGTDVHYRTLSMTVPVKQIIEVFARHNYKIFRLNPRGPLGNKVNAGIRNTLFDETERQRFHLLNNGITAICLSWQIDGNQLRVQDFQIINGCQTTVTLWNVRAAIQDDPRVMVMVKLTECPEHFASRIAGTTNTQTALRAEDFTSNESVQIRLQDQFAKMTPPWFYEIKRGEWQKMMGGASEKEIYRDPKGRYRQLNSKEVAQAVVAFAGYPAEAKDKIRNFLNKHPVSSIARESEFSYDNIYTNGLKADQLLLPAVVQRKVWRQVVDDKATDSWLEYTRFHIVWLVGELLREHYSLSGILFPSNRASKLTATLDDWFPPIYSVALAAIRNALADSTQRGQFTGYREFFRSPANYRAIESNVRGALQMAANFGNPTANLPG